MPIQIRDRGDFAEVINPLRVRWYGPQHLPDATKAAGCVIGINDSHDGVPRGRLAVSNGASWDALLFRSDALASQAVDAVPMVRAAVSEMLPALVAPAIAEAVRPQIVAPQVATVPENPDIKAFAAAILEMAEHVNALQHRCHALEQRCDYLERYAIGAVKLEGAA